MELVLDTRSPNYERSKGEQIAINVDGTGDQAAANYYTGDRMDKQVLTSVKSGLSDGRFVGLYSVHPDYDLFRQGLNGTGTGTSTMSNTSHCNLNETRSLIEITVSSRISSPEWLGKPFTKFTVLLKFSHKLQCEMFGIIYSNHSSRSQSPFSSV